MRDSTLVHSALGCSVPSPPLLPSLFQWAKGTAIEAESKLTTQAKECPLLFHIFFGFLPFRKNYTGHGTWKKYYVCSHVCFPSFQALRVAPSLSLHLERLSCAALASRPQSPKGGTAKRGSEGRVAIKANLELSLSFHHLFAILCQSIFVIPEPDDLTTVRRV